MKSTAGAHYLGLDHLRALAAFMVVAWHFLHGTDGFPVPFNTVPAIFPLALFDEGHVGVALFMTLSGYLFAKLLDGKLINYRAFLWNRAIRLLPLLFVVIMIVGVMRWRAGDGIAAYVIQIASGLILPTLPNGGWSITVEAHYYVLLPAFLWMTRRSRWLPFLFIATAILFRALLYRIGEPVQPLAYWTIIGRVDQFALGMMAFQWRNSIRGRHFAMALIGTVFCVLYTWFDASGGFYFPSYPSKPVWWVFLPTLEGLAFGALIAWYDNSFSWKSPSWIALCISKMGDYSYSIYLLHFFIVFRAAAYVQHHIMDISNFYVALLWAIAFFIGMMPIGFLSYRLIESPILKLRKRYAISPS